MSGVDVLAESVGGGDDLAFVTYERRYSYDELATEVAAHRKVLAARGASPGAVWPVVVEADAEGVITLLALWRCGVVPVPINPRLTEAERARARPSSAALPEDTDVVVWTSGTGGRPRGVALGLDAFRANATATRERLDLRPGDVWLASLSLAHVGGLALLVRTLLLGGTLVATGPFRASAVDALLGGEGEGRTAGIRPTHLSLVPTQLLRLLDERGPRAAPETFRCALIGGAHAPREIVDRALGRGWPLALTYGATEMGSQIATASPTLVRSKPGTVGPPLEGTELRVSPDGEILTRGPTLALGYLPGTEAGVAAAAAPEPGEDTGVAAETTGPATGADAGAPDPLVDASGWYHTGDIGRMDDEGHLWVTGRRADRIVSGGVTIDAVEVEEALRGHPAVIDACVVGVEDAEWGELVVAWIEPVVGEFDEADVDRHVRGSLNATKVPRRFHVGGALPRNANGKVDRTAVRRAVGGG